MREIFSRDAKTDEEICQEQEVGIIFELGKMKKTDIPTLDCNSGRIGVADGANKSSGGEAGQYVLLERVRTVYALQIIMFLLQSALSTHQPHLPNHIFCNPARASVSHLDHAALLRSMRSITSD